VAGSFTRTRAGIGTTTFAALQGLPSRSIQISVGVLAIIAAILASLQSFLDLGARAERHRIAGARYKATIRRLEQLGIGRITGMKLDDPVITEIRDSLDALEADMPVVPPNIYRSVEPTYHENEFVDSVGGRHAR